MKQIKCLICGMNICIDSYNLNNYSFIEKNEKDRIVNCPFCGVDKTYFSNEKEVYKVSNKDLDEKTLKILENAMKLEVFNGEFYAEASKLTTKIEIKNLFNDLKNIEFMHARIHKRLGGFKDTPKLHKPDYTNRDTDKKLLIEAYKREEHAISFYKRNSINLNNTIIQEVFKSLSDVEKQHATIANKKI